MLQGLMSLLGQLPVLYVLLLGLSVLVMLIILTPARLDLASAQRKAVLCAYGAAYVVLSRDTNFQLPPDPGKSSATATAKKRIVFVRHGESAWNECFNRRLDLSFPARLISYLWQEAVLLLCVDSLFIDSPLSPEGIAQARLIEQFLEGEEGEELRRLCVSAVFTCSSLRRAASTAILGFVRFLGGGRPVWVLSCLQEISRNVDTLALAAPCCAPCLPEAGAVIGAGAVGCGSAALPTQCLQAAFNKGNKSLGSHGAHRLEAFCDWVFSPCGPAALQPNVVVTGHSLWFRTFFQAYLPHSVYHECKQAKIVNCGVVAFDLELLQNPGGGPHEYRVVPESIVTIKGGFEGKKPAAAHGSVSAARKAVKSD